MSGHGACLFVIFVSGICLSIDSTEEMTNSGLRIYNYTSNVLMSRDYASMHDVLLTLPAETKETE